MKYSLRALDAQVFNLCKAVWQHSLDEALWIIFHLFLSSSLNAQVTAKYNKEIAHYYGLHSR